MNKQDWTYKKLGEVATLYDSQRKPVTKKDRVSGMYPYYGATGIQDYVDGYIFDGRYLLLGEDGAKWGANEKSAFIIEGKSWVNNHAHIMRFDERVNDSFVEYYLNGKDLNEYITGAVVPKLTQAKLTQILIPVPPIDEQERIVAELDLLSSIIEKKKAQLQEYDQLAQSIFYDMFGDPVTNEKGWHTKKLGTVCEIKGRIGFRGYTKNDFVSNPKEGAISLSPTNIVNGSMDYTKCSYVTWEKYYESPEIMVQNGDILLVKTGSSYGKCSLVRNLPHEATINPQFVVIKDIQQNNIYLTFILSSEYAKYEYDKFVLGTAIPTFTQKALSGLTIPLPPLSLQQEFAEKIEAIERQKALVQASIAETETLFNSRMDHYFN